MIDSSIYLQVDATAIAGIFILLTIGSAVKPDKMHEKITQKIFGRELYFTLYGAVLILIMPFALSAIFIIADDGLYPTIIPYTIFHGTFVYFYLGMTALGFAYIFWIVYVLDQHHGRVSKS